MNNEETHDDKGGKKEREWEKDWDREKSAPQDEETDTFDEIGEKD